MSFNRIPAAIRRVKPNRAWLLLAACIIACAIVIGNAMIAAPFVKRTIAIDGDFSDWDSVVSDPQNLLFDGTGTGDMDNPTQAYRNIARVAYTYDDTNVYFLVRAAASWQSNQHILVYIDRNGDHALSNNSDLVLDHTLNGGGKAWMSIGHLYYYNSANPSVPDTITGDGVAEPGTEGGDATGSVNPNTHAPMDDPTASMWGATGARWPSGTYSYYECRVKWAALGVAPGTPLNFHFSVTSGSNPPGGVVDNTSPGTLASTALGVSADTQLAARQSSVATFTHTIAQTGNVTDTVGLSAYTDNGWPVTVRNVSNTTTLTSVTLRGNETTSVLMLVSVPPTATLGLGENAYLRATSTFRPTVTASVHDQVYPGAFVAYPDNASTCATNTTIDYPHYVANLTTEPLTIDLRAATHSQGWSTPVVLDAGGTPTSTVVVQPSGQATLTVRVSVPATAALGAQDLAELYATARELGSLVDVAHDVTTVRPRVDFAPSNRESCNAASFITLHHTLTNNWSTADTMTVSMASSIATWAADFYDASGINTITPSFRLASHQSTDVVIRVTVPMDGGGRSFMATLTAASALSPSSRAAVTDRLDVVSLATFSDGQLLVPSTTFRLGDPVYIGEAGDVGSGGLEYFKVTGPSGSQAWPSSGLANANVIDGLASASMATTDGIAVGTYTAAAYRDSAGTSLVATSAFVVTYNAGIDVLHAGDAVTTSQTIPVNTTFRDSNSVPIGSSSAAYTVWYDANANGVFDPGDTWIDSAGQPHTYTGSGATAAHTSAVSVPATGTTRDAWSFSNTHLPVAGLYNVTATWTSSSGFPIAAKTSQFYSPGGPWPDATLTKELHAGQPSRVAPGDAVQFDLIVQNTGDTTLTTIPLRDTYAPSDLTYVSGTLAPDSVTAGDLYWSNIAAQPLAPGRTATVTVAFTAGSVQGTRPNTAVSTGTLDYTGVPLPSMTSTAGVLVSTSAFTITAIPHQGQDAYVQAGQSVTFDVGVHNTGATALTTVPLTETFGSGLSFSSASVTPSATGAGALTWNDLGALAPGASTTVTVGFTATAGGSGTATATCAPTDAYSITLPPESSAAGVSITHPAVTVGTIAQPSAVLIGGDSTYTVTVTNAGDTTLSSVAATATYDAARLAAGTVSDGGIAAGGTVAWPAFSLAPGDVKVLTLHFTAVATGTASVSFAAVGTDVDSDSASGAGSADLTIAAPMSGTMVVSGDAAYTTTTAVTIDSSVTNAVSMRVDTGAGYASPVAYAASIPAALPVGDGPKTVTVEYTDALGDNIVRSDGITLDATPPTTADDAPSVPTSRTVSVTLTATDTISGVAATCYSLDGGSLATCSSAIVVSAEGTHTLRYWSQDVAGNAEATKTATFIIDTTAPDVTISAPAEGSVTSASVTPAASSSDPSATLSATLNGVPFSLGDAVFAQGDYTLVVTATDPAGNAASATRHFTIDTTAPDVTITTPAEGLVTSASVTPEASSTDPSATLTATLNGTPFSLGGSVSAEGDYTLVVTATDPAGNAASATRHFTIDTTAPDLTVYGVFDGEITSATVTPTAASSDPSATIVALLDGAPYILGTPITAEGEHALVVVALDPAGNATSETIHFTIDTTAPDVAIHGVTDGTTYGASVTPDASSTDPDAILSATLDGAPYVLATPVSADGTHTLVVTATDPAGNSATATATFRIDTSLPSLDVTGVSDGELTSQTVYPDATTDAGASLAATLDGAPFTLGSPVSAEGAHVLVVTATGPLGESTTKIVTFTIDTTAPDVTITAPSEGFLTSASVTPEASSSDPSATLSATLNGTPFALGDSVSAEGDYTLVVTATDPAGNSASATRHFTIDTTAPDVTITAPSEGLATSASVTPATSSSDPSATLTATLNGAPIALGDSVSAEGDYTLVVTATDPAGNTASATVHFTIDTTSADLSVFGVFEGELTSAAITPTAASSDPSATIVALLDGAPYTLGTPISAEGEHALVVVALDPAGNATSETIHFTIDTTAPDVVIHGVTDGTTYRTAVTPDASSTDPDATLSATLDGEPYVLATPVSADGTHTLVVTATDPAGNTAEATATFRIDTYAPSLDVTGVTNGELTSQTVYPDAATNPGASLTATLDGAPFTLGSAVSAEGAHTLVVTATGPLGESTTKIVTFTIDTTAPDVTITAPSEGFLTSASVTPAASSSDPSATLSATLNGTPFALGDSVSAEGDYTLVMTATDPAGNAASATVHFTIDTTPADLSVFGVFEGELTSAAITPTAASSDPSATIVALLDGAPYILGTPITAEGEHTLVVVALDPAGNATSETIHFTIDRTAPDVTITAPSEGFLTSASVTPAASSSDPSATLTATLNGTPFSLGDSVSAEGDYTLVVTATDAAGNAASATVHFTIDRTAPDVVIHGVSEGEVTSLTVAPTATSSDPSATFTTLLDGSPYTLGTPISAETSHTLVVVATDAQGNRASASVDFRIDSTAPHTLTNADGTWQRGSFTVMFTANDLSGVASTFYSLNGGEPATYAGGFPVSAEGVTKLEFWSVDTVGNREDTETAFVRLDSTPPTTTADAPSSPTSQAVDVSLSATDALSGVATTFYSVDGGADTAYAGPIPLSAEGTHTVAYHSVDEAGNVESSHTATVVIDTTAPDVSIDTPAEGLLTSAPVTPAAHSADPTAMLAATLDGEPFTLGGAVSAEGAHTLVVTATDPAGNSASATVHFTIDRTAPDLAVSGVSDGGSYTATVTPTASSSDPSAAIAATLDGEPFVLGSDVSAEGTHTLVVTVTDPLGNSRTETIVFVIGPAIPPAPAAPTLTATAGYDTIGTDWTDVGGAALAGYRLYRSASPEGPFSQVATLPAGTSSFEDAEVEIGTAYYYQVTAYDTYGQVSGQSNTASATIWPNVRRLWGDDRYGTAQDVIDNGFTSAKTVIVATGENFADALSAAGLAGSYHAPILLTRRTALPSSVETELARLGSTHAIIVGGKLAVDDAVKTRLEHLGLTVDRIGGADRYETAVLIGQAIEQREGTRTIAFLARGDEYPDALALSPLAYALKAPIVLTRPTSLPEYSRAYLAGKAFPNVLVAGSELAVSADVYRAVDGISGTLVRQGGTTRYETAEMVATYGVAQGWAKWHHVEIAVGTNFPDALTGGPAAGERGGILLLTPNSVLHAATREALTDNKTAIAEVDVLGSTRAIDQSVIDDIVGILPH